MTKKLASVFLCLALAIPAAAQPSPAKRLITESDVTKFIWSADPQVSSDGKTVAFVRVEVKKDDYETSIWMAATDVS